MRKNRATSPARYLERTLRGVVILGGRVAGTSASFERGRSAGRELGKGIVLGSELQSMTFMGGMGRLGHLSPARLKVPGDTWEEDGRTRGGRGVNKKA